MFLICRLQNFIFKIDFKKTLECPSSLDPDQDQTFCWTLSGSKMFFFRRQKWLLAGKGLTCRQDFSDVKKKICVFVKLLYS